MNENNMVKSGKVIRGCIKETRGPWVVRRPTKKGVVMSLRYPSERERQNNKERERKRREITRKIFSGLKAHGNYKLPKRAKHHDVLLALCDEAGWIVHHDGTISRKNDMAETGGCSTTVSGEAYAFEEDVNLSLSLSLPTYE